MRSYEILAYITSFNSQKYEIPLTIQEDVRKMTFWETFTTLCKVHGTKPNPLASELGISSGTISQWKNGSMPSAERLILLADRFQCSIDYLLGRTSSPNIVSEAYIGGDNNGIQAVKSKNLNVGVESESSSCNDELVKEFSSVLSDLTIRERTELMTMIYKFADEHRKGE